MGKKNERIPIIEDEEEISQINMEELERSTSSIGSPMNHYRESTCSSDSSYIEPETSRDSYVSMHSPRQTRYDPYELTNSGYLEPIGGIENYVRYVSTVSYLQTNREPRAIIHLGSAARPPPLPPARRPILFRNIRRVPKESKKAKCYRITVWIVLIVSITCLIWALEWFFLSNQDDYN